MRHPFLCFVFLLAVAAAACVRHQKEKVGWCPGALPPQLIDQLTPLAISRHDSSCPSQEIIEHFSEIR